MHYFNRRAEEEFVGSNSTSVECSFSRPPLPCLVQLVHGRLPLIAEVLHQFLHNLLVRRLGVAAQVEIESKIMKAIYRILVFSA
jgi:hypothetical protein